MKKNAGEKKDGPENSIDKKVVCSPCCIFDNIK